MIRLLIFLDYGRALLALKSTIRSLPVSLCRVIYSSIPSAQALTISWNLPPKHCLGTVLGQDSLGPFLIKLACHGEAIIPFPLPLSLPSSIATSPFYPCLAGYVRSRVCLP